MSDWAANVVAATRAAQHLPRHIEDPVALDIAATILAPAAPPAHAAAGPAAGVDARAGGTGAARPLRGSGGRRSNNDGRAPVAAGALQDNAG